jgi:hypothetical protein
VRYRLGMNQLPVPNQPALTQHDKALFLTRMARLFHAGYSYDSMRHIMQFSRAYNSNAFNFAYDAMRLIATRTWWFPSSPIALDP